MIPSPEFDILSQTAKTHNLLLQVGIIEKDAGTLYCTAVLFDRDGSVMYKHRKVSCTRNVSSPNQIG